MTLKAKRKGEFILLCVLFPWKMYQTRHNFSSSPQFLPSSSRAITFFSLSIAQSPQLFPFLILFSCSLIRCKLIAFHMGDGTRLVSILIMVCGLAGGIHCQFAHSTSAKWVVFTRHIPWALSCLCHHFTLYSKPYSRITLAYYNLILALANVLTKVTAWERWKNLYIRFHRARNLIQIAN